MGFFLRKSINLGGIRLNLSNSGIGISTGVKGCRVGIDGKGRGYISGGVGMLRYREGIGNIELNNDNYAYKCKIPDELIQIKPTTWPFIFLNILPLFLLVVGFFSILFDSSLDFGHKFIFTLISLISIIIFSIPYWSLFPKDKYKNYRQAKKAFKDHKFEEAISFYKLVYKDINKMITQDFIAERLYECYKNLDDLNKMYEFLYTPCACAHLNNRRIILIDVLADLGKYDELIEHLQQSFDDDDKEAVPTYYAVLANAFMHKGDKEAALEACLCGPVSKRKMDESMCYFRLTLGNCYAANNDIKNALKQYQKVYAYDMNYENVAERIEKLKNRKED